jgi:hypothetical protein
MESATSIVGLIARALVEHRQQETFDAARSLLEKAILEAW